MLSHYVFRLLKEMLNPPRNKAYERGDKAVKETYVTVKMPIKIEAIVNLCFVVILEFRMWQSCNI